MYHKIEFRYEVLAKFDTPGGLHVAQLIARGARLIAKIKPYVVETTQGPTEMADLLLQDGSVARGVRFASFSFIDV